MIPRAGALVLGLALAACGPREEIGVQQSAITDGVAYSGHPSVGLLIVPGTEEGKVGHCTGTLVGEVTVLTAAHCLIREGKITFEIEEERYQVSGVILHPDFDTSLPKLPPPDDIGLVVLSEAPDVAPSAVSPWAPGSGMDLLLVGYGTTTEDANDSGEKRKATNVVDQIKDKRFSISGSGDDVGNLCHGDSGGPAFASFDGAEVVLGVTSAGEGKCGESASWDTRVDAYLDWLQEAAGGDLRVGDREAPTVKITSPRQGAVVKGEVTIEAEVSDDVAVAEVTLMADGIKVETLLSPPFVFNLSPVPRDYLFEVVATDREGNEGKGQVAVTVRGDLLTFREPCQLPSECESEICFEDQELEDTYCSQACLPGGQECPADSECIADNVGRHICAARITAAMRAPNALRGGCAVTAPGAAPGWTLLCWVICGWLLVRRRPG